MRVRILLSGVLVALQFEVARYSNGFGPKTRMNETDYLIIRNIVQEQCASLEQLSPLHYFND
jgi:hypothetical protein